MAEHVRPSDRGEDLAEDVLAHGRDAAQHRLEEVHAATESAVDAVSAAFNEAIDATLDDSPAGTASEQKADDLADTAKKVLSQAAGLGSDTLDRAQEHASSAVEHVHGGYQRHPYRIAVIAAAAVVSAIVAATLVASRRGRG